MEGLQFLETGAVGLCAGLITLGLIHFPRSPVTRPLIGVAVCAALWAAGDVITAHSRSLTTEQIGIAILYTGSLFLAPLWWLLSTRWARERGSPPPPIAQRVGGLAFAWAAVMWLVMLTNPWHHHFLIPVVGARNVLLPLWWVIAIPNCALVLGAVGTQLWVARRVRTPDVRREASFMVTSSLIVTVACWLYVMWPGSSPFDGTLLVITAAAALLIAGLRVEAQRREFEDDLTREVAVRTRLLDEANHELRLANRRLRALQEQLLRAERLEAEEYLAGSVAHSINNPLAALKGTVQMALASKTGEGAVFQRILELVQRIQDVVTGTLDLVRRKSLDLAVVAPARLIEEVREQLAERASARGIAIELKSSPGIPAVVIDRSLFEAALVALGENALDAVDDGGHIWLEAEEISSIGLPTIAFRIADTGPGIPLRLHAEVFKPFFTTKSGGTGLGLAVAHGVVQGHAGRIRIDDRPGGGTLVTLQIPVRPPSATSRQSRVG
jgi:signal transduction histidine kinase